MYNGIYPQGPQMAQYNPQFNPNAAFFNQQMQQLTQPQQPPQIVPPPPAQQQAPQMVSRAVTSVDEAKAAMIDPLGIYLFTDFQNNAIYVKRINNNGMAEFYTFKAESQAEKVDPNASIHERLDRIENILGGMTNASNDAAANDTAAKKPKPASVPKVAGNDAE